MLLRPPLMHVRDQISEYAQSCSWDCQLPRRFLPVFKPSPYGRPPRVWHALRSERKEIDTKAAPILGTYDTRHFTKEDSPFYWSVKR